MTEGTEEIVLDIETGEPLDVEGWELTGRISIHDDKGNLWEHRSYQSDFDKDGNYEVVTGRVLLEPAPEPEPEPEGEDEAEVQAED